MMRWPARLAVSLVAALVLTTGGLPLVGAASADPGAPSISSDQADYAPGSDVTLTGANWSSGDNVHVVVDDVQGQTWQWQGDTTVGDGGGFEVHLTLPDWFVADYSVLADNGSGTTATTTFTDGNVQVAAKVGATNVIAGVRTTTYRKDTTCSGSTLNSNNLNTSASGFTSAGGFGTNSAMSLLASSPVVYSGRLYTFSGWTGSSGGLNGSAALLCVPGSSLRGGINETANYTDAGQATETAQEILFPSPLADKTFGDPDFTVAATSVVAGTTTPTGLTVTFLASGVCTVSGSTVHLTGVGDCTITATQGGNGTYYAASPVPNSFTVNPGGTTVTVSCPAIRVYTGAAIEPCIATATGAGGLNETLTVSYAGNVDVGTATASASYAGDATHAAGSNSATFAIGQASSSVAITCPASVVYNGLQQAPCTALATGAGPLSQSVTPTYSANTDVGTVTVNASFSGDANHIGSSSSTTFAITRAGSTTTVTCPSEATYTGNPVTPCSATVTGVGGLNQSVPVSYTDNVNVGPVSASASFSGDGNHTGSSGSGGFTITAAASTVVVSCPGSETYSGDAIEPCTATVTGAGGLSHSLTVSYINNVDAGTATASASYDGDASHSAGNDSKTFTIARAPSTTTVTCTTPQTYTGGAIEPCTAGVTGVGGLDEALTPSYGNNVNVGTGSASAIFGGDGNHLPSSGSSKFTITKAGSTVTVTCTPISIVYDGAPHTPCVASASGAGSLSVSGLTVTYSLDHTNVGTVTASATYAGDDNHNGSTGSSTFDITKAASTTLVSCPTNVTYDGSAQEPCTASVTGAGGLDETLTVDYADNVSAGNASAHAAYAGDSNHAASEDTKGFVIDKAGSATTVTCTGPSTYTGGALTPCSATATGIGGLSTPVTPVTYTNNIDAGTAHASATFLGDENHNGSTGGKDFTIDKASSTTTVTCPSTHAIYNGSAQALCSASATGAGLTSPVEVSPVTYTHNTDAGIAGASATWAGDANHAGSTGTGSFVIDKAGSTTTVSCPSGVSYDGSAQTPCTASAIGAGMLSPVTVTPVTYTDNTVVGTGHASATWAGDGNHDPSTGTGTFTISQASSVVTVTCPPARTYTGSAIEPCTAKATGAGMPDVTGLTVTYSPDHTNVGHVTASASWAGDANHTGNSGTGAFDITKATLTVTADNQWITYGDALPTYTAQITGYLGSDGSSAVSPQPTCTAVGVTTSTGAGNYPITCSGAGATNYTFSYVVGNLNIAKKAATIGFTGNLFWSTGSASGTSTNVTFQALVTPATGGSPDLRNAVVVFDYYKSTNTAMTTRDGYCTAGQTSATGIATCSKSLDLDNWTVIARIVENDYFLGASSDPVVLTVYNPATDKFVTGGGWVNDPQGSAANRHGNLGFTVRYKSGTTPSGQSVYVYRGTDGYNYVIKSNSWQGGGLSFASSSSTSNSASFSGKCNVAVIDRATGLIVTGLGGGNFTFRVDTTDNGAPGSSDTYAISVYTSTGALYHQSGTTGSQLVLGGGNVTVHSTATK